MKTGSGHAPLVGSSPTASAFWSRGLAAKAAPLQGDDRWFESNRDYLRIAQVRQLEERRGLNPRVCEFNSRSGHFLETWLGRQSADHLGLEPGMLWVRLPPELLKSIRPRGAAWSARRPVTAKIVGSNPIGDAFRAGTVRKLVKRPSSNLGERLSVRFRLVPLKTNMRRLGMGVPKWL